MKSFPETLAQARTLLDDAERIEEVDRFMQEHVDVRDQLDAAANENALRTSIAAEQAIGKGLHAEQMVLNDDKRAYLFAGLLMSQESCQHLDNNPLQPIFILLRARIKVCKECLTKRIAWPEEVADDCCDLCAEHSDAFMPMTTSIGHITMAGDLCDTCWKVIYGN